MNDREQKELSSPNSPTYSINNIYKPNNTTELPQDLKDRLNLISDNDLLKFVADTLRCFPTFTTAPAAVTHHHNFRGGLLDHTLEVTDLCDFAVRCNETLDRDSILAAALLHDVAKCFNYGIVRGEVSYINDDYKVDHTTWGYYHALNAGYLTVARLIASHHGRKEWGAIYEPETREEQILHYADMISSRAGRTVSQEDA